MESNSGNKNSFLDRGTVTALILVAGVWFGWSKWVESKYPPANSAGTPQAATANSPVDAGIAKSPLVNAPSAGVAPPPLAPSQVVDYMVDADGFRGRLSSVGLSLSQVEIKGFETRDAKPVLIGQGSLPMFGTGLVGRPDEIQFHVSEPARGTWVGVADLGAYKIQKKLELVQDGDARGRALRVQIKAEGDLTSFPGFRTGLSDKIAEPASSSFLTPSYDHHDWFVRHEDKNSRSVIDPKKPAAFDHKNVAAIALSSHYFTAALADRSPLRPEFHGTPVVQQGDSFLATGFVDYVPLTKGNEFIVEQTWYLGPKDVDYLRAADESLARVIDYGMFAVIAEPLLWMLRFFFGLFGNWGFAVIGLTLVVRALVLPFNIYSFRSMKVMQILQPQIQSAKERFKDDPKRMNEEVMRLMRDNKANPLGGCLPMLLQLPIFFAFYQVLAQSIELYKAPFILWIHDLSVKDPYYVLPVLMGVAMFVQQKRTPVADPQQAKILIWMPVIFSFLMFTLPSGLTLYILVSTVFGIVQQIVFMRDKSSPARSKTIREAKA